MYQPGRLRIDMDAQIPFCINTGQKWWTILLNKIRFPNARTLFRFGTSKFFDPQSFWPPNIFLYTTFFLPPIFLAQYKFACKNSEP